MHKYMNVAKVETKLLINKLGVHTKNCAKWVQVHV